MHTKAHPHSHLFGVNPNPANVALAALLTLLFLIFLIPLMNITAVTAQAQNSVPPTARQAATMPQFASRLAHRATRPIASQAYPAPPRASYKNPRDQNALGQRGGPLDNNVLYTNGPINGTTDAWTINFFFVTSDTFSVPSGATITGMSFGAWVFPGDVLQSVEISITSQEFGGTTYFDGVVTFSQSGCSLNQYGYNVCTEAGTFTLSNLNQGTYWVNLQNAIVPNGDPVYWDENSGPSQASENSIGTIPSEAFTILGETTTTTSTTNEAPCPEPQRGFYDLHDFDPGTQPSGLVAAATGKLYGTLANGGSHGAGLLYELTQTAVHWFVGSLYNFMGGSSGSSPNGVIVGPGGVLYGAAQGGIQNCNGGFYCGLIYQARPGATACATALCSWEETTIYQFTGNTDAWGGRVTAFDSAGNLYGIGNGGAYGHGALFKLSRSQGGWTETILHSFTGGNDGSGPNSLLMGGDGNLYGTAGGGQYEAGVVFQFVPSGGGWTENIIYAFTGGPSDGSGPDNLVTDGSGNFYGTGRCPSWGFGYCVEGADQQVGIIFALSRSGGGWGVDVLHVYANGECPISNYGSYYALAIGRGDLYALEVAGIQYYCSGLWDVGYGGLLVFGPPGFGNLTADASGNLYGTMSTCGFNTPSRTDSMVWQLSR